VIVVDNNSSDATAYIAARFPFVKVLQESRQGVVFARNTGFDAVRGDIIGRIDADTQIAKDWVATIIDLFAEPSREVISGSMQYHTIAAAQLVNRVDLQIRRYMARTLGKNVAVQGANMALRRSTWRAIRDEVCCSGGLHEDFDIAIHATSNGYQVSFEESLVASIAYRQAACEFRPFVTYACLSPKTYTRHDLSAGRRMYQIVAFVIIMYPIIKCLKLGYDELHNRFSWRKLFFNDQLARVNPATFVDIV
jgi:glycosyltransferase involved in cell wall biosynthesis